MRARAGLHRIRSLALVAGLVALLVVACRPPEAGSGASPSAPWAVPPSAGSGPAAQAPAAGLGPVNDVESAVVVRVVDGDTVVVDRGRGPERVRYIGIDTPESVRPGTPVEFLAREAAEAHARLVEGRELFLERDVSDRDRFDRLLRYAWLREGDGWRLVNLELVRLGFANAVSFPPDVRLLEALRDAEREAREAGIGLWGPATPVP